MHIQDLKEKGYATLEYPSALRTCVEEAMLSWQRFCRMSMREKKVLSGGDRVNDFGYMRRRDNGSRADDKEVFHVLKSDRAALEKKAMAIYDIRAITFINKVNDLIEEVEPVVCQFATDVERHYGLAGFEEAVRASAHRWVFRYLHYLPGETLAHPHADRGGFTLHLYESEEGGEYLDFNKEWKPWPVSNSQTIIFPSMGMQHRSEGEFKALWHRVKATERTRSYGRFSMVVFIDFLHSHRYDDSKRRLQEFEHGFNYDIAASEFKKLFVPISDLATQRG